MTAFKMTAAQQAEHDELLAVRTAAREALKADRNEETGRAFSAAETAYHQWLAENVPAKRPRPARFASKAAQRHGARAQYNEWAARNGKPKW